MILSSSIFGIHFGAILHCAQVHVWIFISYFYLDFHFAYLYEYEFSLRVCNKYIYTYIYQRLYLDVRLFHVQIILSLDNVLASRIKERDFRGAGMDSLFQNLKILYKSCGMDFKLWILCPRFAGLLKPEKKVS